MRKPRARVRHKPKSPPPTSAAASRLVAGLRSAAVEASHAAVAAHSRGSNIFGEVFDVFLRHGYAEIAKSAYEWVKAEPGRKAVLEWRGDSVVFRHYNPDGTERLAAVLDRSS